MAVTVFPCDQAGSVNKSAVSGGAYTGPGDYATFAYWWGLRAYSSAQLTGSVPAIDIVRSSDGANLVTINITTSGDLDTAAILAHPDVVAASGNLTAVTVSKLYDQVGTAHLVSSGTGSNPGISIGSSGLATDRPSLAFDGDIHAYYLARTIPSNIPQPFCTSIVAIRRADYTKNSIMFTLAQSDFTNLSFPPTANTIQVYAGTPAAVSATDGLWYAINVLWKGNTSIIRVNATSSPPTLDVGLQTISTSESYQLGLMTVAANSSLNGDICEVGIISGDSNTAFAALAANQQAYWGF
jgi:hypothetical protein